jgi:hypothetical protein
MSGWFWENNGTCGNYGDSQGPGWLLVGYCMILIWTSIWELWTHSHLVRPLNQDGKNRTKLCPKGPPFWWIADGSLKIPRFHQASTFCILHPSRIAFPSWWPCTMPWLATQARVDDKSGWGRGDRRLNQKLEFGSCLIWSIYQYLIPKVEFQVMISFFHGHL